MQTTITNLQAVEMYFSFIPPHGGTLAPYGQEGSVLTFPGDLESLLASKVNKTKLYALLNFVKEGKITINEIPSLTEAEASSLTANPSETNLETPSGLFAPNGVGPVETTPAQSAF